MGTPELLPGTSGGPADGAQAPHPSPLGTEDARGPVPALQEPRRGPGRPPGGSEGTTVVEASAQAIVASGARVVSFHGKALLLRETRVAGLDKPHLGYVPLYKDAFERLAYPLLGGVPRSRISDTFAYVANVAPDLTANGHLQLLGGRVWNGRTLDWDPETPPEDTVWRSPYEPLEGQGPVRFVLDLAGGREDAYADVMQSLAPIVMDRKPDGAVWWVGAGANGKSSLMEAVYRLFPGQLASLTVKQLTDGRDTPMLNGHLANVVKESSEGKVEDTQVYKSVGTHEDFRVHKFHSQDTELIRGNMHHIFSANQVPVFGDKGYSARRRTFVIPFEETFESDPTFEERTFTPETLGHLLGEMLRFAREIRDRGYRYDWSARTAGAKTEYDAEANNAEEYAREIVAEGVVGFDSFEPLRADYEAWCAEQGYVPLGIGNMRRALQGAGFERRTVMSKMGQTSKKYLLSTFANPKDMVEMGLGRRGFWTAMGYGSMKRAEERQARQQPLEDW